MMLDVVEDEFEWVDWCDERGELGEMGPFRPLWRCSCRAFARAFSWVRTKLARLFKNQGSARSPNK